MQALTRKNILIVDDQSELRKLYQIIFNFDFEVDEASTAIMAFEKIVVDKPDCVLLDIKMPGRISGLELCKYIKSSDNFKYIKVIILTGSAQENDRLIALKNGADGFFEKPVSPSDLLTYVRNALR